MRPRHIVAVFVIVAALGVGAFAFLVHSGAGLLAATGSAIADLEDGDTAAERLVRSTAENLTSSIGYVQTAVDAETRAATTFTQPQGEVRLTPLVWSGKGSIDDPALVDVRIDVTLAAISSPNIGGQRRSAGSAAGCYRFEVAVTREASSERIDCPEISRPAEPPVATVPPRLPEDAEERVRAVLLSGEAALDAALRAAFPDAATTIETTTADTGERVAAVGVPASRDCVVLVQRVEGSVEPVSFRHISLEPGEAGCSTSLYTNPPF